MGSRLRRVAKFGWMTPLITPRAIPKNRIEPDIAQYPCGSPRVDGPKLAQTPCSTELGRRTFWRQCREGAGIAGEVEKACTRHAEEFYERRGGAVPEHSQRCELGRR